MLCAQKKYFTHALLMKTAYILNKKNIEGKEVFRLRFCFENCQFSMPDNRARYIATVLQAVVLGAVTYYGVKWLVDAMDPTKKSRLAAKRQVSKTCVMFPTF